MTLFAQNNKVPGGAQFHGVAVNPVVAVENVARPTELAPMTDIPKLLLSQVGPMLALEIVQVCPLA